jgi:hypothetical protein
MKEGMPTEKATFGIDDNTTTMTTAKPKNTPPSSTQYLLSQAKEQFCSSRFSLCPYFS